MPAVSADAVLSFRDMNILPAGYQSFHIYTVNGTGTYDLGVYNSTTDPLDLQDGSNTSAVFILQFVPSTADFYNDPMIGVAQFSENVNQHYTAYLAVFVIFCLFCIAIGLARMQKTRSY